MKRHTAATVVGAIWLFMLGGCADTDLSAGSAMPRMEARAQASDVRVSIDLKEIVTP